MRISKRVLALALAVLMVIGMFSTASAADINDATDIDDITPEYLDAVGILYGMDILEGQGEGTTTTAGEFAPDKTLTRAEMTKIVYHMLTGSHIAPNANVQAFDDVPVTSWAAGYVEWAKTSGIVIGYGDGNFRPDAEVTIGEASVMLLRCVGYGQDDEFEGRGWSQQARSLGTQAGLYDVVNSVEGNYDMADPIRREVMAQMTYNTLTMEIVTWIQYIGYQPSRVSEPYAQSVYHLNDETNQNHIITGLSTNGKYAGMNYDVPTEEVGRVASFWYNEQNGDVYYKKITSRDVEIAADTKTTDYDATFRTNGTHDDFAVYRNYVQETTYDALDTSGNLTTYDMTLSQARLMSREQNATYVLQGNDIVSVVYEDVQIVDVTVKRNAALTIDYDGGTDVHQDDVEDQVVYTGSQDLTEVGEKYQMEVYKIGGTFMMSDLDTITGTVTRSSGANNGYDNNTLTLTVDGTAYKADDDYSLLITNEIEFDWSADYKSVYNFYVSSVNGAIYASEVVEDTTNDDLLFVVDVLDDTDIWQTDSTVIRAVDTNGQLHELRTYEQILNATTNQWELKYNSTNMPAVILAAEQSNGSYNFIDMTDPTKTPTDYITIDTTNINSTAGDSDDIFDSNSVTINGVTFFVNSTTKFIYADKSDLDDIVVKTGKHKTTFTNSPTPVYVYGNSSNVADVVFVGDIFEGSADSTDVYFYDGVSWAGSGDGYEYTVYNVTDGAAVDLKVDNVPANTGVGFYSLRQSGNTNTLVEITDPARVSTGVVDTRTPVDNGYFYNYVGGGAIDVPNSAVRMNVVDPASPEYYSGTRSFVQGDEIYVYTDEYNNVLFAVVVDEV